ETSKVTAAVIGGVEYPVKRDNTIIVEGAGFSLTGSATLVPTGMYQVVSERVGDKTKELTGLQICEQFAEIVYLKWYYVLPAFLALFTLFLYLLGKLLAGRLGQFVWGNTERLISRVPLVRNVYSSVKQVTEFFFNQRELEFTRVVAIEYPRKGCWSLGFVTGE